MFFAGGGGGCRCIPPGCRRVSHIQCLAYSWLSQIQCECMSCLSPIVSSRPFFWGRSHWEYAIQATASVWEPLEQGHCVVSGDVDFDSFRVAPWDAGGMHGGGCRFCETFWVMMFQWLIRLSCRPVIINGLDRTMRMNTDYGHERIMTTNVDSPRLAVTPGEWYASEMLTYDDN